MATVNSKAQLKNMYEQEVRPALQKELALDNVMRIPCVKKVVLNVGVKDAISDSKHLQIAENVLAAISGQRPIRTKARKSIAGFKLREGMPIGVQVTLRRSYMYAFLDKLINLALPKVRDFQGVTKKCDGRGNYNLGIREWNIFPEAETVAEGERLHGLNITIQTTAATDEEAVALLKQLGMPFRES